MIVKVLYLMVESWLLHNIVDVATKAEGHLIKGIKPRLIRLLSFPPRWVKLIRFGFHFRVSSSPALFSKDAGSSVRSLSQVLTLHIDTQLKCDFPQ